MRISDWSSDVCSSDLSSWLRSRMTIAAPRFHGFTRAVAQKLLCFEAKRNLTVRGFLVSIASDKALPISDDSHAGQRCQASSQITSALDLPSIAIPASLNDVSRRFSSTTKRTEEQTSDH